MKNFSVSLICLVGLFSLSTQAQDAKYEYLRAVEYNSGGVYQTYIRTLREEVSKAIGLELNIPNPEIRSLTVEYLDLQRGQPETWYIVIGNHVCTGQVVSNTASSVESKAKQWTFDKAIPSSWKLGTSRCISRSPFN